MKENPFGDFQDWMIDRDFSDWIKAARSNPNFASWLLQLGSSGLRKGYTLPSSLRDWLCDRLIAATLAPDKAAKALWLVPDGPGRPVSMKHEDVSHFLAMDVNSLVQQGLTVKAAVNQVLCDEQGRGQCPFSAATIEKWYGQWKRKTGGFSENPDDWIERK
ncbi:hypothetical protein FHS85_005171 [Rhodoligotrophos appendicifer]|uniref:hypothetical protein n=1 Tax=Rhodoligotrophos appendicifer TaxID=987056 RepID=UPI0011871399|nr:hypothetical protein [Rhodoligotrophos appendicifer]